MSEEIYINNGTSFQQPYIARNTVNSQTPVIGQTPSQQPTVGRTPFTYQESFFLQLIEIQLTIGFHILQMQQEQHL